MTEKSASDSADRLKNVAFERQIENPRFIKPLRMLFERKGLKLQWELAFEGDSASTVIYHVERKQLLFVRQFRPAVFARAVMRLQENRDKQLEEVDFEKYPLSHGTTLELCGGLMDKPGLSPKELAIEECYEELGFRPKAENVEFIQALTSVGSSGAIQHLFYATVNEADRINQNSGNEDEGEFIEPVYLDIDKLDQAMNGSEIVPPIFSFGLCWFINNKKHLYT
ncbi:Uridine diphosphate glucose pyrophosphatase [Aphelenchoides bicaudatus]|nr:Uridine diphosphate glucose pyrophosphatase [Aphelenchoides bicaudatus]